MRISDWSSDVCASDLLCHVGPDGASHRISVGVLNLTHCESHEEPAALQPGRRYRARIVLDDVGYRVPAGHRLRVAPSTAYWPMLWPSPEQIGRAPCRESVCQYG